MTYQELLSALNAYKLALTTMQFDAQTIAPKDGSEYRNKAMAYLAGEHFKLYTSEIAYKTIQEACNSEDDIERLGAKDMLKHLNKIKNIPYDEFVAFEELINNSQLSWESAREKKDYSLFVNDLEKLLDSHRKRIAYRNIEGSIYDISLDDYEEGLTMESVERFFDTLEKNLVPYLDLIINAQQEYPSFMNAFVPIDKQKKISELLMRHLTYSKDFGVIGEAAHPFSSTFSINDSRITTHYHEYDFTQNIFSVIHEIGHSMYNHNVKLEYEGTPLADNMSMSMHESQSRFLENIIGRSKSFWKPIYPQLQLIIPEVLENVTLDDFIKAINYVKRGPIRIEADEVTYPLHIMIRYNIEKAMFVDNLSAHELDKLFALEMERLVGYSPKNDAEGILQDVHWSGASFGYFPTYALGSAYAAQFYNTMKKEIDIDKLLEEGDLASIFKWLKENIHQYSGIIPTQTLIEKVTGEPFNPNYYVDYLKEKYSSLLGIDFE